jgi:protein-disulfide isomerase
MVVFSDFECPYSSEIFFSLQHLQSKYGNQLHIIWKQSPLPIHPDAPLAHKAALAAAQQGHFNEMAELLYANQTPQSRASLLSFARQLHLDMARFQRDFDSPATAAKLDADLEESHAFAIEQTPTLYVNGRSVIGVQSEAALAGMIDKAAAMGSSESGVPQADDAPLDPGLAAAILASPTAATGGANAPLTIVEFTDFQCPFCRAAVAPMEQFMADRGREIRWVFRAFPLDFHPEAEIAAEAALAAGEQGKFWQMHDMLFAHQSALKVDDLRAYAKELKLDMNAFDNALATHKFAGQIAADRALGVKAGVNGTPTFFVDGQAYSGVRTLPELNQIADAHAAPVAGKSAGLAAIALTDAIVPDQQVFGPATRVPLTLTWFVDIRSPLAARQAELIHRLTKQYDGNVRVFYRAFALDSHPDSKLAGAALIAALKQDKFWPMYDALAERRDTLDREKLVAIADSLKLDHAAFGAALDDSAADVALDINDAARRGIQGAPVLFINQQRVDGLQMDQAYTAILDSQLRVAPAAQASLQK